MISVIIPTYNRDHLLKDAISSVLSQIYQKFELIIVDDCSKDDTSKVVESFKDTRIVYLKHDKNQGVAAACNTGIKKAVGDYFFILNDDDLIIPEALNKLVEKMSQSEIKNLGGVYGWSWWVNNKEKTLRIINPKERGDIFKKILKRQNFTNLLIKKEVFKEVGLYDENLRSNEDFDFYLRMAKKYQFDFVPEILTIVRKHNQSHLSSFSKENIISYNKIIKKYFNNFSNKKNLFALILPSKFYVGLSDLKNFIVHQIKLIFDLEIKKQIISIKKTFINQGIKI